MQCQGCHVSGVVSSRLYSNGSGLSDSMNALTPSVYASIASFASLLQIS